jgi:hypothetical protein
LIAVTTITAIITSIIDLLLLRLRLRLRLLRLRLRRRQRQRLRRLRLRQRLRLRRLRLLPGLRPPRHARLGCFRISGGIAEMRLKGRWCCRAAPLCMHGLLTVRRAHGKITRLRAAVASSTCCAVSSLLCLLLL